MTFSTSLETFITGCARIIAENDKRMGYTLPRGELHALPGKRYIKIVTEGRVHCFVDATNGDVLKAASWKAPAKHSRGNIFDDHNGLRYMTPYGAAYLS